MRKEDNDAFSVVFSQERGRARERWLLIHEENETPNRHDRHLNRIYKIDDFRISVRVTFSRYLPKKKNHFHRKFLFKKNNTHNPPSLFKKRK